MQFAEQIDHAVLHAIAQSVVAALSPPTHGIAAILQEAA